MASTPLKIDDFSLEGVEIAPPQVFGHIRLVPLIRTQFRTDLRIATYPRTHQGDYKSPTGYLPHSMVLAWGEKGVAETCWGTQLIQLDPESVGAYDEIRRSELPYFKGNVADMGHLNMIGWNLALEGLLALYQRSPDWLWPEYARDVQRLGSWARLDLGYHGSEIHGLMESLRMVERCTNQCGMILFVANTLTSLCLTSHPDDYQQIHHGLVMESYGELIRHYSRYPSWEDDEAPIICPEKVHSLEDLEREVELLRSYWSDLSLWMGQELFHKKLRTDRVAHLGKFRLLRFATEWEINGGNFVGEMIHDSTKNIQFLKAYRLSRVQTERAIVMEKLIKCHWDLNQTARVLELKNKEALCKRMTKLGLGYLLRYRYQK
jgi:hypothetical protein